VRRWKTTSCLFSILVVGLVASSCGGSSSNPVASPTTDPHSTSSALTPTTLSATAAAVLAAYRAGWSAFEHALADANPEDPALAATMLDPQLQGVKANLFADQREGIVGKGTTTLHPRITVLTATTATVVDCAYSATELVYQATGKPVPPVTPPENDGVSSTLVLTAGTWKVDKQTVTDGKCAPESDRESWRLLPLRGWSNAKKIPLPARGA
jgi:hypothetical protein